jgi:hypothetical protein
MTGSSAWPWRTWPSTGASPRLPAAGNARAGARWDRGKLGMKRSLIVEGRGIPLGRVLAPANRHDAPLLAPTLDKLDDLGPLPDDITVHFDAGTTRRRPAMSSPGAA